MRRTFGAALVSVAGYIIYLKPVWVVVVLIVLGLLIAGLIDDKPKK